MNKKEIIKTLEEEVQRFEYRFVEDPKLDGFSFEVAHQWGGEGKGVSIGYVWKLTENSTKESFYVKVEGYYESWDGTDWSYASVNECWPKEKLVTVWETVNE